MNQTQRKFLMDSIESRFRAEREEIVKQKPKEPSLNNFLVASILDGTFKVKDSDAIRKAIHERVLSLGKAESLLSDSADTWGRRLHQDEDDVIQGSIKVPAKILFDLPPRYEEEKKKYDEEMERWLERRRLLESSFEAMKIKIQLGSNAALQPLIDQADSLCSLSLTDSAKLFIKNSK